METQDCTGVTEVTRVTDLLKAYELTSNRKPTGITEVTGMLRSLET